MRCLLLIILIAVASPAHAQPPKVSATMNVGAMGVIIPADGWVGQYIYLGPSLFVPLHERLAFIPMVTFEAAPGSGSWGFVGTAMLELIPPKGPVAIDFVPSIGQDTSTDGTTVAFWAVGPGFTVTLPRGVMIGGAFQIAGTIAHPELGIAFYPMTNIGIPFP